MTTEQSKFVALHVGIFWGIGRFIIKNGDSVNVLIDLKSMLDHLVGSRPSADPFVINRTRFIQQLISQRNLLVRYRLIGHHDNKATSLLS
ncbi:MAG: hypothetical protein KGI33_05565 [Thaumarchaeota archaeon]|nr:hypothetical protein [Nitrososphaerota archaeon]